MIPPTAALIDMDGTLIDTETVIVPVLEQVSEEILGEPVTREQARSFIGPPLHETMADLAGPGRDDLAAALMRRYREIYQAKQFDIELFDGVADMLRDLSDAGVTLALATSKPEDRALTLLDHLGLTPLFTHVCGAPPEDGPGSEKAAVVARALRACGLSSTPERALMLGDRRYDVEGAAACGVNTVLALWAGLADADEQALAWRLANTPAQARAIILGEDE
ncbi:HAD hydrolase-like protein [Nanchangia anserum]|uniref:HAD hydrolase-like protein n=1 Tax=Nanchangia anserum TaxID=2692125 RepID=A0A8I0GCF5_9ACTO|nr:HAD hydrolase-like protein [Nanchangia anserum]MBD3688998.1 HAD hydrolase-like protein [Nanchangia anserum]QOX81246.1 HAD hydrolase-like protein [Nanchangia anserum]